jgi:hypothetical protein
VVDDHGDFGVTGVLEHGAGLLDPTHQDHAQHVQQGVSGYGVRRPSQHDVCLGFAMTPVAQWLDLTNVSLDGTPWRFAKLLGPLYESLGVKGHGA